MPTMPAAPSLLDAFTGKVALVAGASRGIGAETALAFARSGAAVVLGARDQVALESVAERIRAEGGRALAVPTDVGDAGSAERLVAAALDTYGRLDAAFNNATDGPKPAPLADIDPEDFDRGIRTDIRGTFLGMKYQIRAMLGDGSGRSDRPGSSGSGGSGGSGGAIVNMASVAGLHGVANLGAYTTGKAGIIALTQVAALDYADQGVRVNVVAPGPILTHYLEAAGEQAQSMAAEATPMGRVGRPDEVAATVLWLCSDQSSFITGAVLPVDGGQFAGIRPPQMFRQGERMGRSAP